MDKKKLIKKGLENTAKYLRLFPVAKGIYKGPSLSNLTSSLFPKAKSDGLEYSKYEL